MADKKWKAESTEEAYLEIRRREMEAVRKEYEAKGEILSERELIAIASGRLLERAHEFDETGWIKKIIWKIKRKKY